MYKITLLKDGKANIKDNQGRPKYNLSAVQRDLVLTPEELGHASKSIDALISIGVLQKIDLREKQPKEQEEDGPLPDLTQWARDLASELLSGRGLCHSYFMQALGLDAKKTAVKKRSRDAYMDVLEHFKDQIVRHKRIWYWKNKK